MNLGDNIINAFDIVYQTHLNIEKLMNHCKTTAYERGEYILKSPKFLRMKSDNDVSGWNIYSFVLLFQKTIDIELKNGWNNGDVYVMEINLDKANYIEPMINIARFVYHDIKSWTPGVSPASHWVFYDPLYSGEIEYTINKEGYYIGNLREDQYDFADKSWWGIRKVIGIEKPLVSINGKNAYDLIFGEMSKIAEIESNN